jgi:hypothetical protein
VLFRSTANMGATSVNNFARYRIQSGDNLKGLAKKLMGSADKWKTLAVINHLRAPFISAVGGPDLLSPGDFILYPSDSEQLSANKNGSNPSDRETADDTSGAFSALEQAYGRDIRLTSILEGETEYSDLKVDEQSGDFSTIAGVPNVKQGLNIKFATEQGELTSHAEFGAQFPIGHKITTRSFNTFRIQAQSTILSDPRVSTIKSLDFKSAGDILVINASVQLAESGDLTTDFFIG